MKIRQGRGQTRNEKIEVSSAHSALCNSNAKTYSNYPSVLEVMTSLLEDITETEGELRRLLDGTEKLTDREKLRAQFLQARLARLGSLQLVEAQRGEMLDCFTTVMLDEFNTDV